MYIAWIKKRKKQRRPFIYKGYAMNTKLLGDRGENLAAEYLTAHGYQICERKFRTPLGEIDLIARQNGSLIFIEVKTRRSLRYGTPAAAVNTLKQQKIIRTAYWYLRQQQIEETLCRFDVIEIYFSQEGKWTIQQFENAFEVHE